MSLVKIAFVNTRSIFNSGGIRQVPEGTLRLPRDMAGKTNDGVVNRDFRRCCTRGVVLATRRWDRDLVVFSDYCKELCEI